MWWKVFSAVLAAGLAAGLIVFLVWRSDMRADRENNRAAAEWNAKAAKQVQYLEFIESQFRHGDATAIGPETDFLSLRGSIKDTEAMLANAPSRAEVTALRLELRRAKDALSDAPSKQ